MTKGDRLASAVALVVLGFIGFFFRGDQADAIERGTRFLAGAYAEYSYHDPYLQYVYPGEQLACPIDGCRLTYRTLDGFFATTLLFREKTNLASLAQQVRDAEEVFAAILPTFRTAPISNVVTNPGGDGVALDTMCIVGYLSRDRALTEHVLRALSSDDANWMSETYYRDAQWRNIADETWCLRLLLATGAEHARTLSLIERQIDQTRMFLAQDYGSIDRVAALTHMLDVFADAREERFDDVQDEFLGALREAAADPSLASDLLLQANIAIALFRCGAAEDGMAIVERLRSQQEDDGSWRRKSGDALPVLTTARVLTALILAGNQ